METVTSQNIMDSLKGSNPSVHFLEIVNTSCRKKCETKFGFKPEGSVLGVQMSLLPSSFKVYTSNIPANDISYVNEMPTTYPEYPFTNTAMKMKTFIDNTSDVRKLKLLYSLKIDNETVNSIEIKLRIKQIVQGRFLCSNKEKIELQLLFAIS